LNEPSRHTNVDQVDPACEMFCAVNKKAGFDGNKRARAVCDNRIPGRHSCVAVQPAGQIDSHHSFVRGVNGLNHQARRRMRLARRPSPQQRIDNPVRIGKALYELLNVNFSPENFVLNARALKNAPVSRRITSQLRRICKQQYANLLTVVRQVSRNYESIAAVITFAAAHDHRSIHTDGQYRIGYAAPGIFHEDQAAHTILFNRPAIDLADLLAG
jgi:hypothetical protein